MRTYKIKEVGKVITGKTPSTKNELFYNSKDNMFICPPDIKSVRYITNSEKYVSSLAFDSCKSIQIAKNSILIDCIGADLGNVAISTNDSITNQQINTITNINENIALPLYLYYFFSTKKAFFHLIGQNGSTMPIINKSMFENIEINIHDMPLQQHIVNTIGSVDDLIENYNKQVAKLQEIGCKIIDMINDNNESNLMADIVKFEKGYEIGSKKYYSDLKEQSIHYIRVGDLLNISNTFVDKEDKLKYCNNNDILVAFDGAPGRNNIGLSGAYSSGIYKLVCDEKYKGLIYFEINSKMNQSIIKDHSQGTTILHASKSINYLEYAVFDENDLYYFNSIFNQIISLKNKIYLLNSIKENLLNKYFTNQ